MIHRAMIHAATKRTLDVTLSFIGLVVLMPLFIVVGLAVKLDSRGPVLFRQERVGRGGKHFKIIKFRTMVEGAERYGPKVSTTEDSRVTKVGSFLRRCYLDEAPQLLNVLRGDMSLVGPRPETPEYVSLFTPEDRMILSVRPGMTGPSSVLYSEGEAAVLAEQDNPDRYYRDHLVHARAQADLGYVENRSLVNDFRILAATGRLVLTGLGVPRSPSSSPTGWGSPLARSVVLAVLISAALLFLPARALAQPATLYVDNGDPNCSNSGPGTQTQPYCAIQAAANVAHADQTVEVAAGSYPENVTVKKSGNPSSPVTFTAATGATVTVGNGQTHGFTVSSRSFVVVNGFTVTGTTGDGIYVSSSSQITVSGNHVSFAGQPVEGLVARGIRLTSTTGSVVSGNTVDHNSEAGIYVVNSSTGNQIVGNIATFNARQYTRAAPGIDIRATDNIVVGNIAHDNEDSGIQFYTGGGNDLAVANLCYANGDHGIDNLNVPNQRMIGNTIHHNVTAGINVEGNSSGATVVNNVSVDNGINSPRTKSNIRVDANSIAGTTVDSNLVFLTVPSAMYTWGSTSYSSLAAFQSATGQEPHGLQADPGFASPGSGDFHLLAGSPAIDSADSAVSGERSVDLEGNPRADDPATPNAGLGPRGYDDRGAYEFQP